MPWVWCLGITACGRAGFDPLRVGDGALGDGPAVLSCSGLAPTCGPTGTSPCCTSPLVPGGMFYRSYDVGTDNAYIDITFPAIVSDLRLDTYEVTVSRFRQFVNAGQGTRQNPPALGTGARMLDGMPNQGGWEASFTGDLEADAAALVAASKCNPMYQSWTDTPGANESLPINCITWFEATAFCAWDRGFLPTEAEWNYVAVGGTDQRVYPWSVPASSLTIDYSYANYVNGTTYCVNPPTGALDRVGSRSPNGDGKWRQADLAGNVVEWTLDWYTIPYVNPCNDCADLTAATDRSVRGGSFDVIVGDVRGAFRRGVAPRVRHSDGGVRCARPP